MQSYKKIPANTDLADLFPYSRAVRIGPVIEISGTGSYDEEGNLVGENDMYEQAKCIYGIIDKTLRDAGTSPEDLVKATVFTTDISRWQEIARAHREFLQGIEPPAVTVVEVTALMSSEMLVEIEATAVVDHSS